MSLSLIDIAPSAEASLLGVQYAAWVRARFDVPRTRPLLLKGLRGSLAVVASDAPEAITLRFDQGRVTIHSGVIGVPDLTLRGGREALGALAEAGVAGGDATSFAQGLRASGRAVLALGRLLSERRVKVHGALTHVVFATRLARLGFSHD